MTRSGADRVLVTRTQPGASALDEALRRAGFETLCRPVLEIQPRQAAGRHPTTIRDYAVVIFVSVHAVEHGVAALGLNRQTGLERPLWIAVGRTTAAALAAHGVTAVFPEDESSEGILALPALSAVSGSRVLVVAGAGGRELIAQALSARGARVDTLPVYERVPRREVLPPGDIARIGVVVISSADGGRAFADSWRLSGGSFGVRIVAPSERVRNSLLELGFHDVKVSDGASSAAVVDVLTGMTSLSRARGEP